jgi:hypothetical protein
MEGHITLHIDRAGFHKIEAGALDRVSVTAGPLLVQGHVDC